MTPIPTVWWLRPVRSAWRVGAHSAVVWKRLYLRPCPASRSAVGVAHGPPNALDAAKPTSSSRMTRTFGAPSGGRSCSIGGNFASGSFASSGTGPSYGRSGMGRTERTSASRALTGGSPWWRGSSCGQRLLSPEQRLFAAAVPSTDARLSIKDAGNVAQTEAQKAGSSPRGTRFAGSAVGPREKETARRREISFRCLSVRECPLTSSRAGLPARDCSVRVSPRDEITVGDCSVSRGGHCCRLQRRQRARWDVQSCGCRASGECGTANAWMAPLAADA